MKRPKPRSKIGERPLPDSLIVTVCNSCLTAACWQGCFYCEKFKTAGTTERTVGELRRLNLEHPSYWENDPRAAAWRRRHL